MAARLLLVPANTAGMIATIEAEDETPRIGVFELARALDAQVLSWSDVEAAGDRSTRLVRRVFGRSVALAWMGFRRRADTLLSLDERVGVPLAMLLRVSGRARHVMFAHDLGRSKRRARWMRVLGLRRRVHGLLAYTTLQTRFAAESLGFARERLFPIHAFVDTAFFRPSQPLDVPMPERTGMVGVGRARRDYAALMEVLESVPVMTTLVGRPAWDRGPDPFLGLQPPAGVKCVAGLPFFDLRLLYQNASLTVLPLQESDSPAGVNALYESLASGTPVVVSATRGLTDSLRNLPGVVTVAPGNIELLQRAVAELLVDEHRRTQLGAEGRECVEKTRTLELFVQRVVAVVKKVEAQHPLRARRASASEGSPVATAGDDPRGGVAPTPSAQGGTRATPTNTQAPPASGSTRARASSGSPAATREADDPKPTQTMR